MDIITIISLGAISIQAMLFVIFVILNNIDKRQDSNKLSEPDNPLLLTIQTMEVELAELKENNIHMERIAQLEKDIEEARKHAEALSKVAGEYGSTMEDVEEQLTKVNTRIEEVNKLPIIGEVGGSSGIIPVEPSYESAIRKHKEASDLMFEQHQETNKNIIEQLYSEIKSATHDYKKEPCSENKEEAQISVFNKIDEAQSIEELLDIFEKETTKQNIAKLGIHPRRLDLIRGKVEN